MKLTKKTIQLICDLERRIGDGCYNPNSYDGWTLISGRDFRYPITYTDKDGIERKSWSTLQNMDQKNIGTLHYKFGANYLFVGNGLINVLNYLENRFGLDFDELVKNEKSGKAEKKANTSASGKPVVVKVKLK